MILFYNRTFQCNLILTDITLEVNTRASFNLSLWRIGATGGISRVRSLTINVSDVSPTMLQLENEDGRFFVREGDRISFDVTSSPFVAETATSSSDQTSFVPLDQVDEGISPSELEMRLMEGNGVLLSARIDSRGRIVLENLISL